MLVVLTPRGGEGVGTHLSAPLKTQSSRVSGSVLPPSPQRRFPLVGRLPQAWEQDQGPETRVPRSLRISLRSATQATSPSTHSQSRSRRPESTPPPSVSRRELADVCPRSPNATNQGAGHRLRDPTQSGAARGGLPAWESAFLGTEPGASNYCVCFHTLSLPAFRKREFRSFCPLRNVTSP
ncbi:transmembrane protein 263 isoform X1 [Leopardus geoffroyi]|uniref:transmembrane protein 263 isoform X1 n=1 Tax=Leopardus geoffroyi TaxID=46844 RepID=UPI001E261565|nr:transmembrane protein 263 isoform X1 [Leopardus geoffroyi]